MSLKLRAKMPGAAILIPHPEVNWTWEGALTAAGIQVSDNGDRPHQPGDPPGFRPRRGTAVVDVGWVFVQDEWLLDDNLAGIWIETEPIGDHYPALRQVHDVLIAHGCRPIDNSIDIYQDLFEGRVPREKVRNPHLLALRDPRTAGGLWPSIRTRRPGRV